MQKYLLVILFFICSTFTNDLNAQYTAQDTTQSKIFIGSTLFVLLNLVPDDNAPDFAQLNLGYRLTPRDAVSVELKTWKYAWSLGIPYGPLKEAPEEKFPGYIREFGVAVVYQHFWWKGLYTGVHVMNAWQTFKDEENVTLDNGFQIFNTYRAGYHFKLFKAKKFFIEPSIAITHRAYHTEMPDSFKQFDDKWSKFFFGEPGLHFGYNF